MGNACRQPYLDDLRGLAFHLMGYAGGLVHLGTAGQNGALIQVGLKSRGKKRARRRVPAQTRSVG